MILLPAKIKCSLLLSILVCHFCFTPQVLAETGSTDQSDIAILIADQNNKIFYSQNKHQSMIPASIIKLFTSLMAIHYMGENYKYKTEFYLDAKSNLTVKGYGDPLFISDTISGIAETLAGNLKPTTQNIKNIYLDQTFFNKRIMIPGVESTSFEPYNSGVAALCANFNTVNFTHSEDTDKLISAEEETPLLPFVYERIMKSGLQKGRIILEDDESRRYAGHLLGYFLEKNQIKTNHFIREREVQPDDKLILKHTSVYTLSEIIEKLLLYSNNFIANQLYITAGAIQMGPPGSLEKGGRAAYDFGKNNLGLTNFKITEGSGLSSDNRITAMDMMKVLVSFGKHKGLLRKAGDDLYKTGTLTDVRTRCGYYRKNNGDYYPYVIIINKPNAEDLINREYKKVIHLIRNTANTP